jgi:hypothetical protein
MSITDMENCAERVLTAFCWWRPDLPRAIADDYWRDVHGVLAARVAGLWEYRQLRLGANRADLWPSVPGVTYDAAADEQPHGVPHALFRTEQHLNAFAGNPIVTNVIFEDEQHFLARGATQLSPPATARTLLATLEGPPRQGAVQAPTFAVFFRARSDVDLADVHAYLKRRTRPGLGGTSQCTPGPGGPAGAI